MNPRDVERRMWAAYQSQGGADRQRPVVNGPRVRTPERVLDGRQEVKLSSRAKNRMYAEAKHLASEIRSAMCTVSETKRPTNENVEKMLRNEMNGAGKVAKERFKNLMRAQGAPSTEYIPDNLRRRK